MEKRIVRSSRLQKLKDAFEALNSPEGAKKLTDIIVSYEFDKFSKDIDGKPSRKDWFEIALNRFYYFAGLAKNNDAEYIKSAYASLENIFSGPIQSDLQYIPFTDKKTVSDNDSKSLRDASRKLDADLKWIAESVSDIIKAVNPREMTPEDKLTFAVEVRELLDYGVGAATKQVNKILADIDFKFETITLDQEIFRNLRSVQTLYRLSDALVMDVYDDKQEDFFELFSEVVPIEKQVDFLIGLYSRLAVAPKIQNRFASAIARRCDELDENTLTENGIESLYRMNLTKVKKHLTAQSTQSKVETVSVADEVWLESLAVFLYTVEQQGAQKPIIMEVVDAVMTELEKALQKYNELAESAKPSESTGRMINAMQTKQPGLKLQKQIVEEEAAQNTNELGDKSLQQNTNPQGQRRRFDAVISEFRNAAKRTNENENTNDQAGDSLESSNSFDGPFGP